MMISYLINQDNFLSDINYHDYDAVEAKKQPSEKKAYSPKTSQPQGTRGDRILSPQKLWTLYS